MKKLMVFIVGIMLVSALSGCETVRGLGQDIQNTGDNIWDVITKDK